MSYCTNKFQGLHKSLDVLTDSFKFKRSSSSHMHQETQRPQTPGAKKETYPSFTAYSVEFSEKFILK